MSEAYFDPSTTPLDREGARWLAHSNRGFKKNGPLRNGAAAAIRIWRSMRDKK